MNPVRGALPATGALLLALAAAAPAHGFVLGGTRWPGHTITYYDGGPDHAAVRMAVRAWNRSGMRMRFKPVARRRADVRIVRVAGSCHGFAQLGYFASHTALVHIGRCRDLYAAAGVATHELGHILGLNHADRRCVVMNTVLWQSCKQPPFWFGRCRMLERDDVRGAVRRYGGRVRPIRGSPFCPRFSAPAPVTGLTVSGAAGPDDSISMQFASARLRPLVRGAGSPPQRLARVYRFRDACPPGRPSGRPVAEIPVTGTTTRAQVESRLEVPPGRWCYAVWLTDGSRRVARAAAVATVDVRRVGPTAGISAPDSAFAGDEVFFEDASSYGEAQQLTYRWDFGDPAAPGATSAEPYPSHAYASPGTYVVSLTVTDESGQASTATHTIRIDPPESFP